MDSVKVKVPATSANLGPGFDCLGIALNLYNRMEVHEADTLRIDAEGEGADLLPKDASNLTVQAMKRVYEAVGRPYPGFFLRQVNAIPLSSGLGSSASAIVGGILAANALLGNPLEKQELLRIATAMEGHPDNVAPCLFGGLTAAIKDGQDVFYSRVMPDERFGFAAVIPSFELPTKKARQILPDAYSRQDAVHNIGAAVMMYAALEQGLCSALKAASRDRIHQPYRSALIPGWEDINALAADNGALAVTLSGAGPTILVIYEKQDESFVHRLQDGLEELPQSWKAMRLECCEDGGTVKRGG